MHTFPTTQSIDVQNKPIVDLIHKPVKAVYYSGKKTLELFKAMRELMPELSLEDFARAYSVSDSVCDFIESNMEAAQ